MRRANSGSAIKIGPPAIIFVFGGRFLLILKMFSSESNWSTVNSNKSGLFFLNFCFEELNEYLELKNIVKKETGIHHCLSL